VLRTLMGRETRLVVLLEEATMSVLRKGILSERAIAVVREREREREREALSVLCFHFGIRCALEETRDGEDVTQYIEVYNEVEG
jgi:hypothetical protein